VIGLLAVASAVVLIRALVFIHREAMGIRPTYPGTWSAAQCRNLAHFRMLIGLGARRQHLRFDVRLQHPERALRASLALRLQPERQTAHNGPVDRQARRFQWHRPEGLPARPTVPGEPGLQQRPLDPLRLESDSVPAECGSPSGDRLGLDARG
jgi:hypothetical protein